MVAEFYCMYTRFFLTRLIAKSRLNSWLMLYAICRIVSVFSSPDNQITTIAEISWWLERTNIRRESRIWLERQRRTCTSIVMPPRYRQNDNNHRVKMRRNCRSVWRKIENSAQRLHCEAIRTCRSKIWGVRASSRARRTVIRETWDERRVNLRLLKAKPGLTLFKVYRKLPCDDHSAYNARFIQSIPSQCSEKYVFVPKTCWKKVDRIAWKF